VTPAAALDYDYLARPLTGPVRFPPETRALFLDRIIGCNAACRETIVTLMDRDRSAE